MNKLKSIFFLVILLFTLNFLSCGTREISGTYHLISGEHFIKKFEFKDGKVSALTGMFGFEIPTGFFNYEIKGDIIYIHDPQKGDFPLKILNDNTLECNWNIYHGTYKKK